MNSKPAAPAPASGHPDVVNSLVPFAHVADVEKSLAFYALLGFTRRSSHQSPTGRTVWADAASGAARLMLAQASGPIAADEQAVLFYMYSKNVASLRACEPACWHPECTMADPSTATTRPLPRPPPTTPAASRSASRTRSTCPPASSVCTIRMAMCC